MGKRGYFLTGSLFAMAALSAPAFATAQTASTPTEIGYGSGSLGVAALVNGQYDMAAARLNSLEGTTAGDPARLINLGNAYAGMGRLKDADTAYRAAIKAMPVDLQMADGSISSSRTVAKMALKRLSRTTYASR